MAISPSEKVSFTASTSVMVRVVEVPMGVVSKYCKREKDNMTIHPLTQVTYDTGAKPCGEIAEIIAHDRSDYE
jgi:hypothetical protein